MSPTEQERARECIESLIFKGYTFREVEDVTGYSRAIIEKFARKAREDMSKCPIKED
jgi:hypothetical protein